VIKLAKDSVTVAWTSIRGTIYLNFDSLVGVTFILKLDLQR